MTLALPIVSKDYPLLYRLQATGHCIRGCLTTLTTDSYQINKD